MVLYSVQRVLFVYPVQRMLFICLAQRVLFMGSAYINDVPPPEAVEAGALFPFMRPVPVPEAGAVYMSVAYQIEKFVSGPLIFQKDA